MTMAWKRLILCVMRNVSGRDDEKPGLEGCWKGLYLVQENLSSETNKHDYYIHVGPIETNLFSILSISKLY
jgi:hypothetical protein